MEKEALKINIRLPYCAGNCVFCDERTYGDNIAAATRYRVALEKEITSAAEELNDYDIKSVHLRGGALLVLGYGSLENFIDILQSKMPAAGNAEWSVDLMPGEVDDMTVSILKMRGISHVHCGIMGMTKEELRTLHRPYSINLVESSLKVLKKHPELNVSAELVIGIPGQTVEGFEAGLRTLLEIHPAQVRLTRFHDRTKDAKEQLRYAERTDWAAFIRAAEKLTTEAGMTGAGEELIFSMPGKTFSEDLPEAEDWSIMGFGAGESTCIGGLRYHNTEELGKYLEFSNIPEKIAVLE